MQKGGLPLMIRCIQALFEGRLGSSRGRSGFVRSPYGVCSGSVRTPFGVRSGSVQAPFRVYSEFVRSSFGVRSGSVRDPFGIHSESVWAPFGPILEQNFRSQKLKFSEKIICAVVAAAAAAAQIENFCKKVSVVRAIIES